MAWYSTILKENMFGVMNQVLVFCSGILLNLFLPLLIGQADFGRFALITAFVNVFFLFGDFGFTYAVSHFIPIAIKKHNAGRYYGFFLRYKILLVAAFTLIFLALSGPLAAAYRDPLLAAGFVAGAAYFFPYSFFAFFESLAIAARRAKKAFGMNVIANTLRLAVPLALVLLFARSYIDVVIATGAAYGIAVLYGFFASRRFREFGGAQRGAIDYGALKKYLFYGSLATLSSQLLLSADIVIIGLSQAAAQLAVYKIAIFAAMAPLFLMPFSLKVFLTIFSSEGAEKSRKIFQVSLKYGFVVAFLFMLAYVLLAGRLIDFVYGPAYAEAYPMLIVFSLLSIEAVLNIITAGILFGKRKMHFLASINMAAGVAMVALLLALTPSVGIFGAAVIVTMVRLLTAAGVLAYCERHFKMRTPYVSIVGRPLLAAVLAFLVLFWLRGSVATPLPWVGYGILVFIVYTALVFAVGALKASDVAAHVRGLFS